MVDIDIIVMTFGRIRYNGEDVKKRYDEFFSIRNSGSGNDDDIGR